MIICEWRLWGTTARTRNLPPRERHFWLGRKAKKTYPNPEPARACRDWPPSPGIKLTPILVYPRGWPITAPLAAAQGRRWHAVPARVSAPHRGARLRFLRRLSTPWSMGLSAFFLPPLRLSVALCKFGIGNPSPEDAVHNAQAVLTSLTASLDGAQTSPPLSLLVRRVALAALGRCN
jgi:hypothetical protein